MKNNNKVNKYVLQGLCLKCFYLNFREDGNTFICAKYGINVDGVVESCPGFLGISEGLDQLIAKLKTENELPEWEGK